MEISPFTARFIEAMNDRHVGYDFEATPGRKYDYVLSVRLNTGFAPARCGHAYIDRSNGDLYKSDGMRPAKGVRFVTSDADSLRKVVALSDPSGAYLYLR